MDTTNTSIPKNGVKTYKTFRFVDYKVYQESKKWYLEMANLKGIFGDQNTSLWYQLSNNMNALVMNIAAASTRLPEDGKRSFGSAITSANKAVACLDIASDLNIISDEEYETLSDGMKGVVILLKSFIKAMGPAKSAELVQA